MTIKSNQMDNIEVKEVEAPTVEELQKTVAGLQKQVLTLDGAVHQLKETIIKLAIKL